MGGYPPMGGMGPPGGPPGMPYPPSGGVRIPPPASYQQPPMGADGSMLAPGDPMSNIPPPVAPSGMPGSNDVRLRFLELNDTLTL